MSVEAYTDNPAPCDCAQCACEEQELAAGERYQPTLTDHDEILERLDRLEAMLTVVLSKISSADDNIAMVASQVKPVLDEIQNGPIGKLIGMRKQR